MASKFTELAIDCADPGSLARLSCSVLDYEVLAEDDAVVTIGSAMATEGESRLGEKPAEKTKARRSHSLPLSIYSAPGDLPQGPGHAA